MYTPVHISTTDDNIYKYMPCTFKCIYSTFHVSVFLVPKNICHDLWRDRCDFVHDIYNYRYTNHSIAVYMSESAHLHNNKSVCVSAIT